MEQDKNNKKLAYFLPNVFTALNMACGYISIIFDMNGSYYKASMIIILGAIFDSVDGRVARLTGTQSQFGEQFDSLSDLITFGIAPSMLFYYRFLSGTGRLGMVTAFLFLLCGALRLARFNANIERVNSDYFQGLPIPGAACAIVGSILFFNEFASDFHPGVFVGYIVFYSLLMISNVPFPSFKKSEWVRTHRKYLLFLIFLTFALLFIYEEIMILVGISLYVVASIAYAIINREKFKGIFEWESDPELIE